MSESTQPHFHACLINARVGSTAI